MHPGEVSGCVSEYLNAPYPYPYPYPARVRSVHGSFPPGLDDLEDGLNLDGDAGG